MTFRASKKVTSVSTACVLLGPALLLGGCYNEASDFQRLATHSSSIDGAVVYIDCNSHGLVVYAFRVSNQAYRGKAQNSSCNDTRLGDRVSVFYDPGHPATNTLLSPEAALEKARGWYVPEWAFPLLLPLFMIVASIVFPILDQRRARTALGGKRNS